MGPHLMRGLAVLVLGCVWGSVTRGEPSPVEEPVAKARRLQEGRRWAQARAAWERVIDTHAHTPEQRLEAVAALRTLNGLVAPNSDPRRANVWTAKAFIFRALDLRWQPKDSPSERHVLIETSSEEINLIREGFRRFADLVFDLSRGQLRLEYEIEVIDEPVRRLSGGDPFWLGPTDVADRISGRYEPGTLDSVFGYVKLSDGKDQVVPAAMLGGTYGGDLGPGGAGWTGIMWYPGWVKGDGEVELHEWLHQVDWGFAARLRYPDDIVPTSDGGRLVGEEGGDPDYRRKPEEGNWLGFYRHIMAEHITSRMWQEARCRPWEGVTYAREWLVLGPMAYEGDPGPALEESAWDREREPREGGEAEGLTWRKWASAQDMIDLDAAFGGADHAAGYAYAEVRSDRARAAYLWLGYDDSVVAYVNGREVFRFAGASAASPDQACAPIRLRRGENAVLLKVADIDGGWGFYARVGDQRGRAVKGLEWVAR